MSDHEPLPVHPFTGLTALAVIGGRPVWPVLGGAPDDQDDNDDSQGDNDADPDDDPGADQDDNDADPEGADALGDPGKKALDAQKAKWKAERDRRRELERELEEARRPKGDDNDAPDADQIRADAEKTATAKANKRIIRAELKAAASGKLADPSDAMVFIDVDQFEVDTNGDIDPDEIAEAITDLITRKPHLAARATQRFQGTGDGGSRNGGKPKQISSREELAKMSPADRLKAHQDGRLKNLLQN